MADVSPYRNIPFFPDFIKNNLKFSHLKISNKPITRTNEIENNRDRSLKIYSFYPWVHR